MLSIQYCRYMSHYGLVCVQLCILSLDAPCTTLTAEVKIPRQFPSFRITAAGVMEFFI